MQVIEEPFYNVSFSYQGQQGPVHGFARFAVLDVGAGRLKARGVTLNELGSPAAATVSEVEVYAPLPWNRAPAYRVELSGGRVFVERYSDGTWSFENFAPPGPEEREAPVEYEITIQNVDVVFRDNAVPETKVWNVAVKFAKVAGTEEAIFSDLDLNISSVGPVVGALDFKEGELRYVRASSPGLDLAPLRRYFAQWKELLEIDVLRNWDAQSAFYSGEFSLLPVPTPEGIEWRARGDGSLAAKNLIALERRFTDAYYKGAFTESIIKGVFSASNSGFRASGEGAIEYGGDAVKVTITGKAEAASDSAIRQLAPGVIPAQVSFRNGQFAGSFGYDGNILAAGIARAQSVSFAEYSASEVQARVVSGKERLRIADASGVVFGTQAKGEFSLAWATGTLSGFAFAQNVDLRKLPHLDVDELIRGRADIRGLISGTTSNPIMSVAANGNALVSIEGIHASSIENVDFSLTGDIKDRALFLNAAEAVSTSGRFRAEGRVGFDGALDLHVAAASVSLTAYPGSAVEGTAYADLRIGGTISDPSASGIAEVYSATVGEYRLPFVSSQITYANERLSLTDLTARSGVTLLTGSATADFAHGGALSGSGRVDDLNLGQFTEVNVQGLGEGTWQLDGTIEDPVLEATVSIDKLVADKVGLENVRVSARWADGALAIRELNAALDGGSVSIDGSWKPAGESSIQARLSDVSIGILQPYLEDAAALQGTVSGQASARFMDGMLERANADFDIRQLAINGELVGSGFLNAQTQGEDVIVHAELGTIDNYYVLDNLTYNTETRTATGVISVLDASVNGLTRILAAVFDEQLDLEQREQIQKFGGKYNVSAQFATAKTETGWEVASADAKIRANGLTYEEKELGELALDVTKEGDLYVFTQASLSGGPAAFRLDPTEQNYIDESGKVNLDGEFYNIDLNWLSNFNSDLAQLSGQADVSFRATGDAAAPEIVLTAGASGLRYGEFAATELSLGPILIQDGSIKGLAEGEPVGTLTVRGFEAQLRDLNVPFHYPATIPRDEPISARIIVPDRELDDLSRFFGGLDTERTNGMLRGGEFVISGTLENLATTGRIEIIADAIKFDALDIALTNVNSSARLEDGVLLVNASGGSEAGGTFLAEAGIDFGSQSFTDNSHLLLQNLGLRQTFENDTSASGIINADLKIQGGLFEPLISGTVNADSAALRVGGEFEQEGAAGAIPFNPYFDIQLVLENGRVSSGPLSAVARGEGKLQGPLTQADARMDFVVEGGEISLPSGRIQIEEGSTAAFTYAADWRGDREASLVIDLNAHTRVTADSGFGLQRYVINLHVTGDVLADEELNIEASSDPPDLSRSQIMAILGQQQVVENLAGGVGSGFGDFNSQLKNLLQSFVAPALVGQFTRSLERSLGLDYLALDFRQGGVGGITIAKALGNGFTLEYRRVLEQFALAGESLEEIRLTYRPPLRNPILGRLTFGVALTKEGLAKLTFGYSKRF